MFVIPAIDMIGGCCVRLTKGDYGTKKTYSEDPVEMAKRFEDAGLRRLHVVDLEGAKGKKPVNLKTLERIASSTSLEIDFGGGIKSRESLVDAFNAGAAQVTCGSLAVTNPSLAESFIREFGGRVIIGADCKDGKVSTSGWLEESKEDVLPFLKAYQEKGARYVISTDISKDGMLSGPSFVLYEKLIGGLGKMNVIASGGISSRDDLVKLSKMGLYGAIVGKAYYEGLLSLEEMVEAESAC